MRPCAAGVVDVVREFMVAHRTVREVAAHYRSGELRFEEVCALVGDDEGSVLFRLKERCHALFREEEFEDPSIGPEALFDLAVGSLFHEAMKLRENVYQRIVYGPRVRALSAASVGDAADLVHEFEKIIEGALLRIDESLQETEILLRQTTAQFRVFLIAQSRNGLLTRFLVASPRRVAEVFPQGLEALLAEIHGDAATGYARAARSYLDAGFFGEARAALDRAREGCAEPRLERWCAYAEGMQAYLERRYPEAVARLEAWVEAGPTEDEARFAALAHAAVSRLGDLLEPDAERSIAARASDLAERLRPLACAKESPPPAEEPARSPTQESGS